MNRLMKLIPLALLFAASCEMHAQENHFQLKKSLSKELKQVSGLAKDGNNLWAIVDTRNAAVYKLDLEGKIVQTIQLDNYNLKDVEAVTVDDRFVYVADVGDNDGTREHRTIVRIAKSSIGKDAVTHVSGELIEFTFPDEGDVKKKKSNNYDCEAVTSHKDSLYVFTKRREDMKTELYALPKSPGTYSARRIAVFKTKGLVTDAAFNEKGNELALVGYDEGHTRPFIWFFSDFSGDNFFSGNAERFEFTNEKKLDWQIESVSYKDRDHFFIACEKTKDVDNTIYLLSKSDLIQSKKGRSE